MSDNRIVSSIGKNYTIAYDGNRNLTGFNHIKINVDDTINKSMQLNAAVEEINLSDEFIGEKINTEITIEEYKEMLVKSGFYEADINRLLSGEINAQELIDEIMNDFENTSRIENLLSVSYLRFYGLEYANMNELLASINEKNIQIEKIESDRNSLQQTNREMQDMLEIIKGLQQGFSLEQILSMPMWQYIDENGNIQYTLVEDPNLIDSSGKYSYKKVTYGFLYEDSILLEELKKLTSTQKSILGFEWDSYKWTNTDEQNAFLQKLTQESERLTSEVTNSNNQLNELKQQILTNQSIYDYINNEVVVYINNNKYIGRDDFETNNQFNTSCLNTINQIKEKSNLMTSVNGEIPILYVSDKSDIVDVISCLINGDGSLSGGYFVNETSTLIKVNSTDNMIEHYVKWAEFLTEEEKEVFNYIYNTEGTDAAYTYLEFISSELDQQWLIKKIEDDQELASEYPWLTSIASIFVTPVEGMSAFYYSMNSLINGDKIRRTDVYSAGNIWRGQVAQDIYNYWKENENETLGSALSFAYNTGMSMADSVTLIGANVATCGTMAPVLSVSLMGSRSYVSTLNDALDRGMSDGSAIALAFSSAVVESAMENYSLGHLMDLESKLGETTLKLAEKIASKVSNEKVATIVTKAFYLGANALSQGLAEGEEEFATEILNYVADIFIAKDLSNYSLSIENYLAQGYTEEEALLQTMKDFSVQAFQAFTGGFASGVCFGSFSGTSSTIKTSYAMSQQMYTDLKGTTEATQFVEAIRKNQAQIETYQETIEALKKGETLTVEQVNLITKGTIEQQAGVAIKEEIKQKLLNLRNNFNQENNLKYKLSDRKWSNKYYKELAQSYDDLSFLSQNTGKHLEEIFFDNENVIGIHRCGMMDAERIMDDGLLLTGHLSSGMSQNQSNFKLDRNISFYDKTEMGYLNFIRELKNAGAYKTLDGTGDVIIVSIPKSEIVYDSLGGVTFKNSSSAIDFSGVTPKLSSEYLLGYLNSSPDVLSDIKFNSKTKVGSMEQSENITLKDIDTGELKILSLLKNKKTGSDISSSFSSKKLTNEQLEWINDVNAVLTRGGKVSIDLKNTKELTSEMLEGILDLSQVSVRMDLSLSDFYGNYMSKYEKNKYIKRVMYTGNEAYFILKKMEELETKVDMSLSTTLRAKQIYDIISSEIPIMRSRPTDEHWLVSQSLRGIVSNNIVGEAGLVCAGYASIFREMCNRCNIQCDYIRGRAVVDLLTGKGGGHAWNVFIDEYNRPIPVDVTWKVSSGVDWFGGSQKFQETHIADSDEMFKEYMTSPNNSNIINNTKEGVLNTICATMDQYYGEGSGLKALEEYVKTGNPNRVTRQNGARDSLQLLAKEDIVNYINSKLSSVEQVSFEIENVVENIIETMASRYGIGNGFSSLRDYVITGDSNRITRMNGARDSLQYISKDDIKRYLDCKIKDIESIISTMDQYYGEGSGFKSLVDYIKTGNSNRITRQNGARDSLAKISIVDIKEYLKLSGYY